MGRLLEAARFLSRRGAQVRVCQGNLLDFEGDAVVNAANESGLGGGGIDGAISDAGGPALFRARLALPEVSTGVRIPTGDARITRGGRLKVPYVIHSVGPCYPLSRSDDMSEEDEQLASAYSNAVKIMHKHKLRRVAFSLISAGVFRGARTVEEVLEIGCLSLDEEMHRGDLVMLAAFTEEELDVLLKVAKKVFKLIPPRSGSNGTHETYSGTSTSDKQKVEIGNKAKGKESINESTKPVVNGESSKTAKMQKKRACVDFEIVELSSVKRMKSNENMTEDVSVGSSKKGNKEDAMECSQSV